LNASVTAPSHSASGHHLGSEVGPEQSGLRSSRSSVEKISRKQRLEDARRIRESERERRDIECGLETLESKAEKLRAILKALRSARSQQTRDFCNKNGPGSGLGAVSAASNARAPADNDCDLVRSYPLGRDRDFRVYWFIPDVGRIWIEDPTTCAWCYLKDKAEISQLQIWLSPSVQDEVELVTELTKYLPTVLVAIAKFEKFQSSRQGLESAEACGSEDLARSDEESDVGDSFGDQAAAMRTNTGNIANSSVRHRPASLSSSSNMPEIDRAARSGRKSRVSAKLRHPPLAATRGMTSKQDIHFSLDQKASSELPSNHMVVSQRRSARGVRAAGTDAASRDVAHDSFGTKGSSRKDQRYDAIACDASTAVESEKGRRRSVRLSRTLPVKRGAVAVTESESVAVARRTRAKSLTVVT
jgi:hypothetical protein